MKHSTGRPSKAEQSRIRRMLALGCAACRIETSRYWNWLGEPPEVHHILRGNRLGHNFTIPLCAGHHRGQWSPMQREFWRMSGQTPASIATGRKGFNRRYGSEYLLWMLVQKHLMLPSEWPVSKIFKRAS